LKQSSREKRTAELYGEIHAFLEDGDPTRDDPAAHMAVPKDFLEGKKSLDAGCGGKGWALRKLFALKCRDITAIDLSVANIEGARRANADIAEYVKFDVKNILELDYPQNCFDFIHSNGVIHHTACPKESIRQLYRCLKPGGSIYIGLYGSGGLLYTIAGLARAIARVVPYGLALFCLRLVLRKQVVGYLLDYLYVSYLFNYTESEAQALLTDAGFGCVRRLKQPLPVSFSIWDTYLKPGTYDPNTRWGRAMVGSGWIVLMAEKPTSAETRATYRLIHDDSNQTVAL
jgi:SAM-dependent methyltransferase